MALASRSEPGEAFLERRRMDTFSKWERSPPRPKNPRTTTSRFLRETIQVVVDQLQPRSTAPRRFEPLKLINRLPTAARTCSITD